MVSLHNAGKVPGLQQKWGEFSLHQSNKETKIIGQDQSVVSKVKT